MKAADVMTTGAATVRPDAPVTEAARIMLEHRISGLPVVDSGGKLVGIITERDFLRRRNGTRNRLTDVFGEGASAKAALAELRSRRVEELMTKDPLTIGVDTPADEIAKIMERENIKRLPVIAEGAIVGIVSRANLLLAIVRRAEREEQV